MMEHAGIIILKGMSGLVVGTWENSEQTVYVTSISLIPVVWKMNNAVSRLLHIDVLGISQYHLLAGHSRYPFFHSTNSSDCHVLATVLGPSYVLVTMRHDSPNECTIISTC